MTLLPCSAAENYGFKFEGPWGMACTQMSASWAWEGRRADRPAEDVCTAALSSASFHSSSAVAVFWAVTKVSWSLVAKQTLNRKTLLPAHWLVLWGGHVGIRLLLFFFWALGLERTWSKLVLWGKGLIQTNSPEKMRLDILTSEVKTERPGIWSL